MRLIATLCIVVVILGCTFQNKSISDAIAAQFVNNKGKSVDLSVVGSPVWERVCILPPYSRNIEVENVLGFKWDAEGKTEIAVSDSINVLVFVKRSDVVAYVEHPRNKGDFSNLSQMCVSRESAKFLWIEGVGKWIS